METKCMHLEINKISRVVCKTVQKLMITLALALLFLGCTKGNPIEEEPVGDSVYSGSGNFDFSGDFDMTFVGNVTDTKITKITNGESLPLTFKDAQGKELFIGLRDSEQLSVGKYTLKEITSGGYAGILLEGEIYDSGAIGGKGTVTINTLNAKEIKAVVNMRLARPLNTADTVMVIGSFQLKSE